MNSVRPCLRLSILPVLLFARVHPDVLTFFRALFVLRPQALPPTSLALVVAPVPYTPPATLDAERKEPHTRHFGPCLFEFGPVPFAYHPPQVLRAISMRPARFLFPDAEAQDAAPSLRLRVSATAAKTSVTSSPTPSATATASAGVQSRTTVDPPLDAALALPCLRTPDILITTKRW
ncbi:hypothetical protein B0H14DRAFT_2759687, partial [Mycena olivaceomarginata]